MAQIHAVTIRDPQEPLYNEAVDVASEFLRLKLPRKPRSYSGTKGTKRGDQGAEGEPELLRTDEGLQPQPEPTQLPASLSTIGPGDAGILAHAASGPPPPPTTASAEEERSKQIAERLIRIGDSLEREVTEELTMELTKLFLKKTAFSLTPDEFMSLCRRLLSRFRQQLPSGWHQVTLIYNAMTQAVEAVRLEAADTTTDTTEQQLFNYVGLTLRQLGFLSWISRHGGMEHFGDQVAGSDVTVPVGSSVDSED